MILLLASLALLAPQDTAPAQVVHAIPSTARVRVVHGPKMEPVAGAEVRSFISPEYVGLLCMDDFYWRLEPALQKASVLGSTDEHGEFVVAVGGNCVLVEARVGGLWGVTRVLTGGEDEAYGCFVIELHPDLDITVRVVDAEGRALAGIPVSHRVDYSYPSWSSSLDYVVTPTGADGVALLRHVGHAACYPERSVENQQFVAIAGAVRPAVVARLDPEHPPTEPIVLHLPPTGEVEVSFEETDGTAVPIQGGCVLAPAESGVESRRSLPFRSLGQREAGTDYVKGTGTNSALFRHVGLDTDWDIWVQRNALSRAVRAKVRGPHRAGERVHVAVRPSDTTLILGQFLDEKGSPRGVVEYSVQRRWMPPAGGWPPPPGADGVIWVGDWGPDTPIENGLGCFLGIGLGPTVLTDEQGRLRFDFDSEPYDVGDLYLTFVENRGASGERSVCTRYENKERLSIVDLGKLVLPPSPVIASGSVRDDAGNPLSGALIQASSSRNGGFRFSTKSLADGKFCVRGSCFEEFTDLRVEIAGYVLVANPGIVKMGSVDVEIVMRKAGAPKPEPETK